MLANGKEVVLTDDQQLRVYWWNGVPNFGDLLSKDVVQFVSGRSVVWSKPVLAHLFAVGSIGREALRGSRGRNPDRGQPIIWGSGCMSDEQQPQIKGFATVCAVRGPLTATLMGAPDAPFGDPGILAAEALGLKAKRTAKIGIVPHWRMLKKLGIETFLGNTDEVVIIDPGQTPSRVAGLIASCDILISSSLHGLIVADSYGVPNVLMRPVATHESPMHKFADYAKSVGRSLGEPLEIKDLNTFLRSGKPPKFDYADNVSACKARIAAAFPDQLKTKAARRIPRMVACA